MQELGDLVELCTRIEKIPQLASYMKRRPGIMPFGDKAKISFSEDIVGH